MTPEEIQRVKDLLAARRAAAVTNETTVVIRQ